MKTKRGSLTLALEGDAIPLEKFKQAVTSFLEIIESVSHEAVGNGTKIKWNISVKSGSAIVSATPEFTKESKEAIKAVVASVQNGIKDLSRGKTATAPKLFNATAIKAMKRLASVHEIGRNGLTAIRVLGDGVKRTVTHKVATAANEIIGASHEAYGSIEGKLQALWDRDGFKFTVFDSLFDRRVECYVDEELVASAIEGFRKRVRVSGIVQYNRGGLPISISAKAIQSLLPNSQLPGASDVRGILNN
jgi:hypothetical protein